MLNFLFLICAAFGGTIMVMQVIMMLMGMGDDFDSDLDTGGDFDIDADLDMDADHQTSYTQAADADVDHADSTGLFEMLSIRGIIAAIAFFGIGGLWAQSIDMGPAPSVVIGALTGFAAMYAIYWMMKQLFKLRASGTVNINNTVGRQASIYVPVPASGEGRGKVHLTVQGRTMEYEAVTDENERLSTGDTVVVTGVVGADLVKVAREKANARVSV